MKKTKDLLDESRDRAKARFAEQKEIEAKSSSVRGAARRACEDLGQACEGCGREPRRIVSVIEKGRN